MPALQNAFRLIWTQGLELSLSATATLISNPIEPYLQQKCGNDYELWTSGYVGRKPSVIGPGIEAPRGIRTPIGIPTRALRIVRGAVEDGTALRTDQVGEAGALAALI